MKFQSNAIGDEDEEGMIIMVNLPAACYYESFGDVRQ